MAGQIPASYTHCAYCEQEFISKRIRTRDHFVPISKNGSYLETNVQIVCQYCNNLKGNFLPEEFIYWLRCRIEWKEYPGVHGITYNEALLFVVKKNVKKIYEEKTYPRKIKERRPARTKYLKSLADDCRLSVNTNTPRYSDPEYILFLQNQTKEQYELAKKHGWKIAKAITEPEPNFHCE